MLLFSTGGIIFLAEYVSLLLFASLLPSLIVLIFFWRIPKRKWFYWTHFIFWCGIDFVAFFKFAEYATFGDNVTLSPVLIRGSLYLAFKSILYLFLHFKWDQIKISAAAATLLAPLICYAGLVSYFTYDDHRYLDQLESRPDFGNLVQHQGSLYLVRNKNYLHLLDANQQWIGLIRIPAGLIKPQIVSTGSNLYLLAEEKIKYYQRSMDRYIPHLFVLKEKGLEEIPATAPLGYEGFLGKAGYQLHASNGQLFIAADGIYFLSEDRFVELREKRTESSWGSGLGSLPVYFQGKWFVICAGTTTLCEFQWDSQSVDRNQAVMEVKTYESFEPMFLLSDSRIFVLNETQQYAFLDRALSKKEYKDDFDHIKELAGSPEELYLLYSWGGRTKIIRLSSSKAYEVIEPPKESSVRLDPAYGEKYEPDEILSIVWQNGVLYAAFKQSGVFEWGDGKWRKMELKIKYVRS